MNLREKLQAHIAALRLENPLGDKGKERLTLWFSENLPSMSPCASCLIEPLDLELVAKLDGFILSNPSEFTAYGANVSEWLVSEGLAVHTISDGTLSVSGWARAE